MNRYLERIGVKREGIAVDLTSLNLLQRQHLLTVPFENLDIHWRRPIVLSTAGFYDKIVNQHRGGFCYELNGLFNELLTHLGFTTRLISARVFHEDGSTGPEFDHAAIIVDLSGEEYIVDVGFGDFAALPLKMMLDEGQLDSAGTFMVRWYDDEYLEVSKREKENWKGQYVFKNVERDLSEFTEMCDFQQYSPDSHFRKGKVCSVLTVNGRKTLTDTKFLVSDNAKKERPIDSHEEFRTVLIQEFGITGPEEGVRK